MKDEHVERINEILNGHEKRLRELEKDIKILKIRNEKGTFTEADLRLLYRLVRDERQRMSGPTVEPQYKSQLTKLLNKLETTP